MGNDSDIRDQGSALIIVIGLGFAFVLMGMALAVTSVFASGTSTVSRAGVQAQAAADAGIDNAVKQLNSVGIGSESSFACSIDSSVATAHGTSDVTTEIKYRKVGDPEGHYACNPGIVFADNTEIIGAELVSTATLGTGTGSGDATTVRSVKQVLDLDGSDPSPPLFAHGFFSHGSVAATNNFKVDGGGVFTNGNFECNSSSAVIGAVTAIGTGTLTNNCSVDSLWTGGVANCTSNGTITGDLTVAASGQSTFQNTCSVGGDAWFGGNIFLNNSAKVDGDVVSAAGKIQLGGSAKVGGSAKAASTITGGVVAGAKIQNTPSPAPAAPVAKSMPSIAWSDLVGAPAGTPEVKTVGAWAKENAIANGAQSWAESMKGTNCNIQAAGYDLNGGLRSPNGASVIDGRSCSEVSLLGPMTLTLNGDLTIVASKFTSTNGLTVVTANPAQDYKLRVIVPLAAGASSCSGVGNGEIRFQSGGFTIPGNVDVFLYTNGRVTLTNSVTFSGSVYGCSTNLSNDTSITYKDVTPPGMTDTTGTKYNFRPVMRFDVRSDA